MNIFVTILTTLLMSSIVTASPLMYVPTGSANDVVIIDLATDAIIGRIDELEDAHGLSASRGSEYLVAGSMKTLRVTGPSSARLK